MTDRRRDPSGDEHGPNREDMRRFREYEADQERLRNFRATIIGATIVGLVSAVANNAVGIVTWVAAHFRLNP